MKQNYPVNEDCPLTDKEKEALDKVLDKAEWSKYAPLKNLTSAYVETEVDGYDEFEIEATITWGVDGQWSDFDFITIERDGLPIIEKIVDNEESKH